MQRGAAPQVESTGQAASRPASRTSGAVTGLEYERFFTREGIDPFDEVEWDVRSAVIGNEKGKVVFEQRDVEIPKFWSQQATNIVVSKYFPRDARHARARAFGQAAHRPRGRHHHRVGRQATVLCERG
jgi:hypothetical protein